MRESPEPPRWGTGETVLEMLGNNTDRAGRPATGQGLETRVAGRDRCGDCSFQARWGSVWRSESRTGGRSSRCRACLCTWSKPAQSQMASASVWVRGAALGQSRQEVEKRSLGTPVLGVGTMQGQRRYQEVGENGVRHPGRSFQKGEALRARASCGSAGNTVEKGPGKEGGAPVFRGLRTGKRGYGRGDPT